MGLKTSGFDTDEAGERVLGQAIGNRVIDGTLRAIVWSDQRYRDYERQARGDAVMRSYTEGAPEPLAYQSEAAARWRGRYPERLRDAGDLERALAQAAATPVPDDDDLADNTMNLRRRIMGQ